MLPRVQKTRITMLLAVFSFLSAGCFSPVRVTWDQNQPPVGPRGAAPQGRLTVYGECYQPDDEESLDTYRRIVFLYNDEGQFLGKYGGEENGNEPVQVALAPGRYILVSRANGKMRKVQVAIENGEETIVSERRIARSPLAPTF